MVLIALLALTILLSLPPVQTLLAREAADYLNEEFGTDLSIGRLRLVPLTLDTRFKGIYLADHHQDTLIYIRSLKTSITHLRQLLRGNLEFGSFDVDGLHMKMRTYQGDSLTNLDIFIAKVDDGQPRDPSKPPFRLASSEIRISDSRFRLMDDALAEPIVLDFSELNATAREFLVLGPEVQMQIEGLSAMSHKGIFLDQLDTRFRYNREQMRFDDLYLRTLNSELNGRVQFDYVREELRDFTRKVRLTSSFRNSVIALNEINAYVPIFGRNKKVSLQGEVSGTMNDLKLLRWRMRSGQTRIDGNFDFFNLFDSVRPFRMQARMNQVSSNYSELRGLLPGILGNSIPSSFRQFGQFTLAGETDITPSQVIADVDIETEIGNSVANLTLSQIDEIDRARYIGKVSMEEFDLGAFLENPKLGKATLLMEVEGEGFTAEFLKTTAEGTIDKIEYNGYGYRDTQVKGNFRDQFFSGSMECKDPNAQFWFAGTIDVRGKQKKFDFGARIDYANLHKLRFIKDTLSEFRGRVGMNVTGNNIDDLRGGIGFTNSVYTNSTDTYNFEFFSLGSQFSADSVRTITLESTDIVNGEMSGRFKLGELGPLLRNAIGSTYTNYQPEEVTPGQSVDFNFRINKKIVEVFLPEVSFGPDTRLEGKLGTNTDDFNLSFSSSSLNFYRNELKDLKVLIDNQNQIFNTYVEVGDMNTVYYDLEDFQLINTKLNDTLFFRAKFQGGERFQDQYQLNFYHTFNEGQESVIGLKKSSLTVKGNEWLINKDRNPRNKIVVNRTLDSIRIDEIVLDNDDKEKIRINGFLADSTYKDLNVDFRIVSLNKVTPVIDSLRLDGQVDGKIKIYQNKGRYLPSSELSIQNFSVNRIPLGDLEIGVIGNNDLTRFSVNSSLSDHNELQRWLLFGNVLSSNGITTLDLTSLFTDFRLEPFAPLGEDVIASIRGGLNGQVKITGRVENPLINGNLNLRQGGFRFPYLNVDYDFDPVQRIDFEGRDFVFRESPLTDVTYGTRATLNGKISHSYFGNWELDFDIDTQQDRLLILDTPYEKDALYYGTAFVNGTGKVSGKVSALTISFLGSTAAGTSLKIPLNDVSSIGDYSFINFVNEAKGLDADIRAERRDEEYEGLELAFDLNVTPDAEVEVVVDPQTGSSLKGTGKGLLLMEINTNGKFNMYGDFATASGTYNYKYGGLIDKSFTVRPGGYITWDGDPWTAQLDLEAVYSLSANPSPLLDNANYTGRIPVDVVVRLDGELEKPNIDFDIEFPNTSSVVRSELAYRLQDPTIEERNAVFLLAQGTFVNDQLGLNQQALAGNLLQTGFGLFNEVLGGGNDKLDIGLLYEPGVIDPNADFQTENRIGFTVSTQISDRILVNGRVGVPVGGVSETLVAGDVEVQLLLNEDGSLSAKIFNRENEIQQFLSERQGYTQGMGLSYQVDFDSFRELLRRVVGSGKKSLRPDERWVGDSIPPASSPPPAAPQPKGPQ